MERFLEGIAQLRLWYINPNNANLLFRINLLKSLSITFFKKCSIEAAFSNKPTFFLTRCLVSMNF